MRKVFKKKILATILTLAMVFSIGSMTVSAAEVDNSAHPIMIGEFSGTLAECWDSDVPMPRAVANVRINSYATYDSDNGIQVKVKLYVPLLEFPKPEFTSMSGTVTVSMNNETTDTSFAEFANGDSTIESDIDTGVKGNSGDSGTVSVSGVATANNALAGGGAFAISYPVKLP